MTHLALSIEHERAATPPAHDDAIGILGVRVHPCSVVEARERIGALLASPGQHTIVPVNPEMVMAARSSEPFRAAINAASLSLPDGAGVLLALRLRGARKAERVPGVDAVEDIAAAAARERRPVYLLGAAPGVAEEAGRALAGRHAGLIIAGCYAGSPEARDEDDICARINATAAEILLVAYGAPRQELWLARNLGRTRVRLAMAVGGTFDFLAGHKPRAPRWMQRAGLEWLFRLAQEPRRWRRMLALPRFAVLALWERDTL